MEPRRHIAPGWLRFGAIFVCRRKTANKPGAFSVPPALGGCVRVALSSGCYLVVILVVSKIMINFAASVRTSVKVRL